MPWFKVDDKLHDHRKARQAKKAAMGVWVLAGSWCMDNLTDGFVPADVLLRWGTPADARALVAAGLWIEATRDGEKGWQFHDWTRFQPSAAVTAATKAAEQEAGVRGNHERWHVRRGVRDPDCEHCHRVPDQEPDWGPDTKADRFQPEIVTDSLSSSSSTVTDSLSSSPGATSAESGESGALSGETIGSPIGSPESGPDSPPIPPEPQPIPHTEPKGSARGDEATAQTLVAEWLDHCTDRPPSRVIGQVSRELKTLIGDGIEVGVIRHGLAAWSRKQLHPATLASVVHEQQQSRGPAVVTLPDGTIDESTLPPVEDSWMKRRPTT